MLANNTKLALRKVGKEKLFSTIVVSGLAVSLLVCLLIGLFVKSELSYDDFQSRKDRILLFQQWEGRAGSGSAFADVLKRNLAGGEEVTRVIKTEPLITAGDKGVSFYEKDFCFAEANFPALFDLFFLQGNAKTAFNTPNFFLLSKSAALKYFGTVQATGKLLYYNKKEPLYVTGVFDDLPANSHIAIDFICDYNKAGAFTGQELDGYWDGLSLTYLLRPAGTETAKLEAQLPVLIKGLNDQNAGIWKPRFIPLKDIYLREKMDDRVRASNAIVHVYVFSAIALCIILLAAFNYVNMVTANAVAQVKAVSVRRVLGAGRKQLLKQYLTESFVYVFLSAFGAWLIAFGGVPVFNHLAGTSLAARTLYDARLLLVYFGSVFVFALINGLYPAYFLSSFKPLTAMRHRLFNGNSYSLRKALVVFQFTVSLVLLTAVIVVSSQLRYIHRQHLGYNRDEVLTFVFPSDASLSQKKTFLTRTHALPAVSNATLTSRLPGEGAFGNKLVESYLPPGAEVAYQSFTVDENFIKVFGIRLLQGRNFRATDNPESNRFLINRTMSKLLRLDNAVGKPLAYYSYQYGADGSYKEVPVRGEIIGVIDDYHQADLRTPIQPLLLQYNSGWETEAAVKLNGSNIGNTLAALDGLWKKTFPANPLQYQFLNERFNQAYKKDTITGNALNVFAGLAVLISCLGLLGLTAITVQQKVKEIGIRKVLGASVAQIILLVAKTYLWLIVLSIALAVPVAWYATNKWLQSFAYRISVSWWMFAVAAIATICIALLTVSFQSIKAALANPVKSLRTE